MDDIPSRSRTEIPLVALLPNMLTIAAICAGLTAIRFGILGNTTHAVQLILAAAVLDGIDGRLARLLKSESRMGAELDSLADFLNFGVAPPLVIYFWTLQDTRSTGWLSVLIFAVCCVVRLARFNVSSKSTEAAADPSFFVGVPAPAGALLVFLPIYASFAFGGAPQLPDAVICIYMVAIGLLMISRIPVWSFKTARIARDKVKFLLVGFAFLGAMVLTYFWITLVAISLGYIGIVIWAILSPGRATAKGQD